MRILLDTHIFLWLLAGDPRFNAPARAWINGADKVLVSSASVWEIAIKVGQGKLSVNLDEVIAEIAANGFEELPVYARHAKGVTALARRHGDPFDRLLVAQAITETTRFLTADAQLAAYSDLVVTI